MTSTIPCRTTCGCRLRAAHAESPARYATLHLGGGVAEPLDAGESAARLATPENHVAVSSATVWEIAIKGRIGRLTFPVDEFDDDAQRMGFDTLPIAIARDRRGGIAAASRGSVRPDADRAGGGREFVLVTSDHQIGRYDVRIFGR